ncbi:hypothetical protein CU044_1490 [Streptomyces sp. L-9-10]|nr:hypothetical protein CU044_1490 [Streptomyces sp. L-9-10]
MQKTSSVEHDQGLPSMSVPSCTTLKTGGVGITARGCRSVQAWGGADRKTG